jgi:hypothetical protein
MLVEELLVSPTLPFLLGSQPFLVNMKEMGRSGPSISHLECKVSYRSLEGRCTSGFVLQMPN